MKLKLITLASVCFCFVSSFGQGPVNDNGLLKVNGNQIENKSGEAYSVAGNSFFWSGFQTDGGFFYRSEIVDFLATEWKSGIVRAAMAVEEADGSSVDPKNPSYPEALSPNPSGQGYYNNPQGELAKMRTIIDAAIANDVYVIVDFHTHFAHFFKDEAIEFFTTIATEYGGNDHIIYEIFNEPIGTAKNRANGSDNASFSQFDTTWNTIIKPYAIEVINAIRAIDPDNLIVVGTPGFSQGVVAASNNPITTSDLSLPSSADLNVAYTLHFYAGQPEHSALRSAATTAMNNDNGNGSGVGIALFVTEWGTVAASGDGAVDKNETLTWMRFLKDNNISHANWSVSDKPEGASAIQAGRRINGLLNNNLTESGNLVKCVIENWDAGDFASCDVGVVPPPPDSTTEAVKVEVETPSGGTDPSSLAKNEFRSSGFNEQSTTINGSPETTLCGFTPGEATVFNLPITEEGSYTIKVLAAASASGTELVLTRDAGTTTLATTSLTAPAAGFGLQNYQTYTFTGIPLNNSDGNGRNRVVALEVRGGSGSVCIESLTYQTDASALSTESFSAELQSQISLYPIPTTDYINIESPKEVSYTVFSTSGQVIISNKKYITPIDVTKFTRGLYFIQLQIEKQTQTYKFVKN